MSLARSQSTAQGGWKLHSHSHGISCRWLCGLARGGFIAFALFSTVMAPLRVPFTACIVLWTFRPFPCILCSCAFSLLLARNLLVAPARPCNLSLLLAGLVCSVRAAAAVPSPCPVLPCPSGMRRSRRMRTVRQQQRRRAATHSPGAPQRDAHPAQRSARPLSAVLRVCVRCVLRVRPLCVVLSVFASMVHLIPQSYYAKQQDTDNKVSARKQQCGALQHSGEHNTHNGMEHSPLPSARCVRQFTHSKEKANVAAPRQSIKETSKQGVKAKAKFDPKNYTSVLVTTQRNTQRQTRVLARAWRLTVCAVCASLCAEQRQVRQG